MRSMFPNLMQDADLHKSRGTAAGHSSGTTRKAMEEDSKDLLDALLAEDDSDP